MTKLMKLSLLCGTEDDLIMGTRSIIKSIKKRNEKEIPFVGVDRELCDFLYSKKIINGIGIDQNTDEYANGIDCLAAQFIRDFKTGVDNLYIFPVDCKNQNYNYGVIYDENELKTLAYLITNRFLLVV